MNRALSSQDVLAKAKPHQIYQVAHEAGIRAEEIELLGPYKAKISPSVLERLSSRPFGRLLCVTSMTPTEDGEGKTCTSIALTQALKILKKKAILCLPEPSMAMLFGRKGVASGAGLSQILPVEDINLHFTGDIHAVETAHNLLAASLDNHIHRGNSLGIDPGRPLWRRSLDVADRQLREIVAGVAKGCKFSRIRTGFDTTASSELMAILSLATSVASLKSRLGRVAAAYTRSGKPVTPKDLKAAGAVAVLLKDALKPNLVQTLQGQPVFVHTNTFAHYLHGSSSVLSLQLGLKLASYVVTETGFSAELGFEKMCDLLCREGGFRPGAAVLVASLRAVRSHAAATSARKPLESLRDGLANIEHHVRAIRQLGVEPIVAINRFESDPDEELRVLRDHLRVEGIECAIIDPTRGGEGAVELAEIAVRVVNEKPGRLKPLYEYSDPVEEKLSRLAAFYGADGASLLDSAREDLDHVKEQGLEKLPVLVAKTPYSLTDDPSRKGVPSGWKLKVSGIRAFAGAGFLLASCGKSVSMPGLPERPGFEGLDLSDDGSVRGLFG